jgi:hypothetical protein
MSAQEKKITLPISEIILTFFFTCSGPKISFENQEISWKSVGSREKFKKILLDVSEFGIKKSFFTMSRWPSSALLFHTLKHTHMNEQFISKK